MTVLESYNNILIELNKVQAPSLLLDDFVYIFNKGIQEYINERYNLFETKQQLTDDLRVLLKSVKIDMSDVTSDVGIYGQNYKCVLPSDYLHLLNCTCEFIGCNSKCNYKIVHYPANKINTNQWAQIVQNDYLKPSYRNPYYYIMNLDDPENVSNSYLDGTVQLSGRSTKELKLENSGKNVRYGNAVQPVVRIVYGNDTFKTLSNVYIDYLRAPIYYSLSEEELDSAEDISLTIEFQDYVVYEIINRVVRLILENNSNPRVQTHTAVNQSIA